jgi:hypothetical protein
MLKLSGITIKPPPGSRPNATIALDLTGVVNGACQRLQRERPGRMAIVRGSSARSDGTALTMLSSLASGICGNCFCFYANYYNQTRTHLSLNKDAPVSRAIQTVGRILPVPILGGLHHQYVRI